VGVLSPPSRLQHVTNTEITLLSWKKRSLSLSLAFDSFYFSLFPSSLRLGGRRRRRRRRRSSNGGLLGERSKGALRGAALGEPSACLARVNARGVSIRQKRERGEKSEARSDSY
jgi:hypothetical protein